MSKYSIYLLLFLLVFARCAEKVEEKVYEVAEVPPPPVAIDLYSTEVDSIYGLLSLEEKINQLFWMNLELDKPLKKEESIPSFAFANVSSKHIKNVLWAVDSSILKTKYFSKSYFSAFESLGEKSKLSPEDLLTISDSTFWKEYFLLTNIYNQDEEVICYLPDSIALSDAIFDDAWHAKELILLDSLYAQKRLIGVSNDSVHLGHNEFFANKNFGVTLNLDSIPSVNDTVCKINLLAINFDSNLDEHFIQEVLLGNYDAAYFDACTEEQLKVVVDLKNEIVKSKLINDALLEYKVRKCIALKLWSDKPKIEQPFKSLTVRLKGLLYQTKYKSISVFNNDNKTLPISDYPKKKWAYLNLGKSNANTFRENIQNYTEINEVKSSVSSFSISSATSPSIIILREKLDSIKGRNFEKKILEHQKNHKTIVINMGNPSNLKYLTKITCLVNSWIDDDEHLAMAAQGVMGGNPIDGSAFLLTDELKTSKTRKTRLAYTIPEEVGIDADSIKKMDKIAAEAIWGGATPGCQVFAAKDGKVFYNKAFGYHTYLQKQKVNRNTVYDIASVTKVASTTLCGMHMYDKGYYKLQDSLKLHLPDSLNKYLGHFSRLYNVNFQRLFTHTSGLPAGLPIYKMIDYIKDDIGRWDSYYCDEKNNCFKVEVAKDFYIDSAFLDSLWLETNNIWTGEKKYKYSDANMNVLYQIFRSKLKKSQRFEKYMDSIYYVPLDLQGTCFLPLTRIDTNRIVPTEEDNFWRKQLIKGHVHDPNAAIYGGVAGNAGLFSTASDLGIIMQMLMFGGEYGGKRYIQESTVKKFSVHQEGSHRGLGFDKPTASSGNVVAPDCPYTAYGHTGFTGICVWNDPENDVVFTFVSNRVHPTPNNKKLITMGIRKRLHQVIYNQLYYNGTYKNKATDNVPVTKLKII